MKSAIMVVFLLLVSSAVFAQDEVPAPPEGSAGLIIPAIDVCAKIACAGHGTCVVVTGQPTCACNEGYQPDMVNGLSCVASAPTAQAAPTVESGAAEDGPILSEHARVEKVLDGIDLSSKYSDYQVDPMGTKSFADYMYEVYRRRKIGATVGIVLGAACIATGLVFYLRTLSHLFDDDSSSYITTSVAFFAVGGVTLGISTVGMLRNRRRLTKLDKVRFDERHEARGPRFLGVAPQVGDNSLGLASGFIF